MPTVPARVTLARTGGIAGTRPPADEIDCAVLPADQFRRVVELVESAGFFSLPCELPEENPCPDSFQYTLCVRMEGGHAHEVTFSDRSASEPLRQLKQLVRGIARKS